MPVRSMPTVAALLLSAALFASSAHGRPASFHADVARVILHQDPLLLVDNVRIIDGTGAPARENASLLIRDGRISAIDGAGRQRPDGAVVIDGSGKTLLPGLVMLHEHLLYLDPTAPLSSYTPEHLPLPPLYLAGGTTTMRTTGTMSARDDLQVKALIEQGRLPGPELFVTGPFIEGPGSFAYQMKPNLTDAEVRLFVRYWVDAGVSWFKAYMNVSRPVLGAAIEEAHRLGARVTGHLCSVTFEEAIALGIDNLEHGLYVASDLVEDKAPDTCPELAHEDRIRLMDLDNPRVVSLIERIVESGVPVTSTLPVFAAGVHPAIPTRGSLELLSPRSRQVAESRWIDLLQARDPQRNANIQGLLQREMAFEKALVDAGGQLLVGTDPTGWGGTLPPNSTHAALILLVEAGFTPLQVLSMATLSGARFLGVDDKVGTVAVGKQADLVLVQGNPDEDILTIQNVTMVIREGVAYDPAALLDTVRGTVGR